MFFHDPNNSLKYARIEEERRFLFNSIPKELLDVEEYIRVIDVFEGTLVGSILAEIEGRPGEDITLLPVPDFVVQEVTGDPVFSGGNLAGLTAVELQEILSTYGIK